MVSLCKLVCFGSIIIFIWTSDDCGLDMLTPVIELIDEITFFWMLP